MYNFYAYIRIMELENLASFNPRECISGKMMRLNRVTANIFRKYLSPFGVTDSQLTLLFILSVRNNLNQKELSEIAKLEKSSLNRILKRLIDSELISKENFPKLSITSKGLVLVNDIIPEWKKAMSEIEVLLESDGKLALDTLAKKLLK
jgi:DNA-binding MarR family transcriptional regulator